MRCEYLRGQSYNRCEQETPFTGSMGCTKRGQEARIRFGRQKIKVRRSAKRCEKVRKRAKKLEFALTVRMMVSEEMLQYDSL